jgi:uncharacterized protein
MASPTKLTYYVYRDRLNQYRWQLVHDNGNIIADSGEGYYNRSDCINGINLTATSGGSPIRDR